MYTFLEEVVFQAVSSGWNQPLAVEINRRINRGCYRTRSKRLKTTVLKNFFTCNFKKLASYTGVLETIRSIPCKFQPNRLKKKFKEHFGLT